MSDATSTPRPSRASRTTSAEAGVPGTEELLGLVEQLARALDRSDLVELEVEAGGTSIVLRRAAAIAPPTTAAAPTQPTQTTPSGATPAVPARPAAERPSVKAPLTGIFYSAPAPGSAPYVTVGSEVGVGQVIGLIEAMKLFNEIKSDLAGRVVRVAAESGTLVKARQPLIEVDPL
jgi:acetyl-CoA carboxylase biotin carboxyl carrier protein